MLKTCSTVSVVSSMNQGWRLSNALCVTVEMTMLFFPRGAFSMLSTLAFLVLVLFVPVFLVYAVGFATVLTPWMVGSMCVDVGYCSIGLLCGLCVALGSGDNQVSLLVPEYARHTLAVGGLCNGSTLCFLYLGICTPFSTCLQKSLLVLLPHLIFFPLCSNCHFLHIIKVSKSLLYLNNFLWVLSSFLYFSHPFI